MKPFKYLGKVLATVCLCMGLAACGGSGDDPTNQEPTNPTPEKPAEPQEPKVCTVTINLEDIVKVEETPLTRVGEKTDLYLIYVTQKGQTYTPYAYGVFSKTTGITIKLTEKETYSFQALAVKDGMNKIFKGSDGVYALPFNAKATNDFNYTIGSWSFKPDHFYQTSQSQPEYIIPDLEAFYSKTVDYTAADNGGNVNITFGRFRAFGIKFIPDDMPEGKLLITLTATKGDITSTSKTIEASGEKQVIVTAGNPFSSELAEGLSCTLTVTWVKDSGEKVGIPVTTPITFKENMQYNITIKVDYSSKAPLTIGSISEIGGFDTTENYSITNGTANKI